MSEIYIRERKKSSFEKKKEESCLIHFYMADIYSGTWLFQRLPTWPEFGICTARLCCLCAVTQPGSKSANHFPDDNGAVLLQSNKSTLFMLCTLKLYSITDKQGSIQTATETQPNHRVATKLPPVMGTLLSKPPPPGSQLVLPSEEATHLPHVVVQPDVLRVLPQAVLPPLRAGAAAGPAAGKHTGETRVSRRKAAGKGWVRSWRTSNGSAAKEGKAQARTWQWMWVQAGAWPPHGKPPWRRQTSTHPRDKNPDGNVASCLPGSPVRVPGTWNAGHATALMPSLGKSLCLVTQPPLLHLMRFDKNSAFSKKQNTMIYFE